MCGIVGIVDLKGRRPIDGRLLESMNQTQLHRGPDDGGIHVESGVGLGHRRLSIIDLSGGHQPLYNEDHSVVVVYNGEIYNFRELSMELEECGHSFRTHCDTEVIVHAWEQWGEQCVQRFRGMFAFAIWDSRKRSLFLARDRLGIKPLYYAVLPDGYLIFASELKALLVHPGLARDIDPSAVEDYFVYGYVPEPKTILKGAQKLSPGYTLVVSGHAVSSPKQYWEVPFSLCTDISEDEAAEELIYRLREAVRIRLISEVPLGAFLSGGVDSSAVVAMMAQLSGDPVNTCSISFGEPKFNESEFAAQVAERYQTNHYIEQVEADDFDLIDKLASIYDEPYADSSAIPTYKVCGLARKNVTVALSGDGGDENLAGYRRHRWHKQEERIRAILPQAIRGPLCGVLSKIYPRADWAPRIFRAKSTLEALSWDSVEGYLNGIAILRAPLRRSLFSDSFKKQLQGYQAIEVLERHARAAPVEDALSKIQYIDMKTYLVGDILTKVDRASMAHSLEVRVPLLDHELVEWISCLPPNYKLRAREGKYIFKKALRPYLPDEILYRPKKGFGVPIAGWFRGPLRKKVQDSILGSLMSELEIFDMRFLKRLVDQHQSGAQDHSSALWALLMFESFHRNVLRR